MSPLPSLLFVCTVLEETVCLVLQLWVKICYNFLEILFHTILSKMVVTVEFWVRAVGERAVGANLLVEGAGGVASRIRRHSQSH